MLVQVVTEHGRDRDGAPPGAALGFDVLAALRVPRPLDPDHASREIDVGDPERHQFAAAEARVERGGPQRLVSLRQGVDEPGRFLGWGDPVAAPANGREAEVRGRVDGDDTLLDRLPVDRAA